MVNRCMWVMSSVGGSESNRYVQYKVGKVWVVYMEAVSKR